ncbi:MAG: hypothetical protein IPP43_13645 [Chitinophagaceae bacterium]|nr:hypothetical protein [Chitinophagaceae bacterium]
MLTICVNATIRTVSNNPGTIAQFNTIQAAVDVSLSGDSIYVHGSPVTYASFTIASKQLTIIGPGFAPDKDLGFLTTVNGCTINGVASSNTEIQGIKFTTFNVTIGTPTPANLRFFRNF